MEAVRPAVDAYVLAFLTERLLSMDQLGETREGSCRLASTLAAELADTLAVWREQVAPHTERLDADAPGNDWRRAGNKPTPLTHSNLIASIDRAGTGPKAPPHACPGSDSADLRALRRPDQGTQTLLRHLRKGAHRDEKQQPGEGRPASSMSYGSRSGDRTADNARGIQVAAHHQAAREWSGERQPPWEFQVIREALQDVPVAAMAAATGSARSIA